MKYKGKNQTLDLQEIPVSEENTNPYFLIQGKYDGESICTLELDGSTNPDRLKANAKLISHSLELLQSTQYYFDVLEEVQGENWDKNPDHVLSKMLNAVKKATE